MKVIIDFARVRIRAETEAFTWLRARIPFFRLANLSDLISNKQIGDAEPTTLLQEWEPDVIIEIALQGPDLDTFYVICLIGWAFQNGLVDLLGLEQWELAKGEVFKRISWSQLLLPL